MFAREAAFRYIPARELCDRALTPFPPMRDRSTETTSVFLLEAIA
jgi:hypothetical protein